MRHYTIVVVPDGKEKSRRYSISYTGVRIALIFTAIFGVLVGYAVADYLHMRGLRTTYLQVLRENRALKGEARILMSSLDDVKGSLKKVKEYSAKLTEITNLQTQSLTKRTGIASLAGSTAATPVIGASAPSKSTLPSSIDIDSLVFRPVFARLDTIAMASQQEAFDLQKVISKLSQQKTLLASIPSLTPVDGWVTSGFGERLSPFTGESTYHKGIDVASPVGTPIYAPADGVVVFSGKKAGFGNFVMIAHGYGIVTGYGHNAQNLVAPGQVIKRGEQVATVGQTGRTTGPHLHYEVMINGRIVDPKRFILNIEDITLSAH